MRKKSLIGGLTIVGVLLIGVLGISLFVDINQFRPQLERQLIERRLDFLQADDIGLLGGEPVEQLALAGADAVDVPGSDFHFVDQWLTMVAADGA